MDMDIDINSIGLDSIKVNPYLTKKATILATNSKLPGIVFGETGTGKEIFTELVHKRREFHEGKKVPLVSVNCANLNTDLALSILFGHVKGSFSSAEKNTSGLVAEANKGILFLDEIHALSIETQRSLLRVLNDGTYCRLGDTKILKSEFQVIAASTKDLDDEVEKGNFLLDLRSRITGLDVYIRPLRERKDEIPGLLHIFFKQQQMETSPRFIDELTLKISKYYWQSNIRQLFCMLNAWVAISDGYLDISELPEYKSMFSPNERQTYHNAEKSEFNEISNIIESAIVLDISLSDALQQIEKIILEEAIVNNNNITDVYRGLRISRNNFYIKRRKYGLATSHYA
jgi:DNA-binding NtrC family response regulator